ncbi:LUD domain-containing protein [Jiulongibacter sediminis]|uniref:LutC/YkgG family protein n=1 Tax=Jiulongibacter sediminis TaxID=1605367 RepID=UPI0026ED2CFE|nr:LUD domain-containing protein [Jiulongibacter sediminis]
MSSREEILGRLRDVRGRMSDAGGFEIDDRRRMTEDGTWNTENGTSEIGHPTSDKQLPPFNTAYLGDPLAKFKELIEILHGEAIEVSEGKEIEDYVSKHYSGKRILFSTSLPELNNSEEWEMADPHTLEDVEFALVEGTLGVAENGAIWLTEEQLSQRVAPFINQQLGIVIKKDSIVPTMAQAYEKLGDPNSGYCAFIAGPSKTADIEQSLVTGAHGARGLVVFLV